MTGIMPNHFFFFVSVEKNEKEDSKLCLASCVRRACSLVDGIKKKKLKPFRLKKKQKKNRVDSPSSLSVFPHFMQTDSDRFREQKVLKGNPTTRHTEALAYE